MLHIVLHGRVQGVGCRYLTKMHADQLGIKGTVRNLISGDVEIYAQGSKQALDHFLNEIRKGLSPVMRVDSIDIDELEDNQSLHNFAIM